MKTFRVQTAADSHKHIEADSLITLPCGVTQLIRRRTVSIGSLGRGEVQVMQTIHEVVCALGPQNMLCVEIEVDDDPAIHARTLPDSGTAGVPTPAPASGWKSAIKSPPPFGMQLLVKDANGDLYLARRTSEGGYIHPLVSGGVVALDGIMEWTELPPDDSVSG